MNAPYEAGLMHSRIATEMRERVTVREEGRHAKEEKNEKEKPRGMPSRKALSWFTFILTIVTSNRLSIVKYLCLFFFYYFLLLLILCGDKFHEEIQSI